MAAMQAKLTAAQRTLRLLFKEFSSGSVVCSEMAERMKPSKRDGPPLKRGRWRARA
jgi:hypothetical protein